MFYQGGRATTKKGDKSSIMLLLCQPAQLHAGLHSIRALIQYVHSAMFQHRSIEALFFSVGNDGCGRVGWVSVGKGGNEWVRVGRSGIFV